MSLSSQRLLDAVHFAAQCHADQRRKNRQESPYINHPIAVAHLLMQHGVTDIELLCAAILHDTVEDTDATFKQLEERFGEVVCSLVREVTDDKSLPKQRRKELQVEHAPTKSPRAKQLKIADKISNLRDIDQDAPASWQPDRKREYVDWAEAVVRGCRGVNQTLEKCFDQELRSARQRLNE